MNDEQSTTANEGYALGELARAFATATTHEDEATRHRADERVRRWMDVVRGMLNGSLRIGSREPVAGLPVWVTPQVVRGGFATGRAAAETAPQPDEADLARRFGLDAQRRVLFAHHLTEAGLAELTALLDSGAYRIDLPEQAALPVVAWLLRAGDRDGALALLEQIGPYADRLRFSPVPGVAPAAGPDVVWRETAADARDELARRRPNPRIEAQREALTVWNPFADELLTLWCGTVVDGRVAMALDTDWQQRAADLLRRYEYLAANHTLCTKHRRPKENLAILLSAVREQLAEGSLSPRVRGLLQHAVDSMIRRRGRPGSPELATLRAGQAAVASRPTHHELARVLVRRLAALPPDQGIADVEAVLAPVGSTHDEPRAAVPVGFAPDEPRAAVPDGFAPDEPRAAVPDALRAPVRRATAGTVEELMAAGVVPSAEVLASLVPQIAASTAATPYRDEALRALMAATYRAFRNRRSLLLLNLESQVRLEELPWVRAVRPYHAAGDDTRGEAHAALRRLGELALDGFPATILPNPLVRELSALSREAGLSLPWTSELAADIFEGTFSASFPAAAKVAAKLLRGTLYERYYGIDYAVVLAIDDVTKRHRHAAATSPAFDALCRERANTPKGRSVAANGMAIEQAQILTTHNLAALVTGAGVRPASGWAALADRAFDTAIALVRRLPAHPRPLPMVKDIAYAWRQLVFFLSLTDEATVRARLTAWSRTLDGRTAPVSTLLAGLADPGSTEALLGWTTGPHWMAPRTR